MKDARSLQFMATPLPQAESSVRVLQGLTAALGSVPGVAQGLLEEAATLSVLEGRAASARLTGTMRAWSGLVREQGEVLGLAPVVPAALLPPGAPAQGRPLLGAHLRTLNALAARNRALRHRAHAAEGKLQGALVRVLEAAEGATAWEGAVAGLGATQQALGGAQAALARLVAQLPALHAALLLHEHAHVRTVQASERAAQAQAVEARRAVREAALGALRGRLEAARAQQLAPLKAALRAKAEDAAHKAINEWAAFAFAAPPARGSSEPRASLSEPAPLEADQAALRAFLEEGEEGEEGKEEGKEQFLPLELEHGNA